MTLGTNEIRPRGTEMKTTILLAFALLISGVPSRAAEPLVSGPQAGAKVTGYFDIAGYKCGGAEDGIAVGSKPRYY